MIIYLYDGSSLSCEEIEFGAGGDIIADEYRMIPACESVRIVSA